MITELSKLTLTSLSELLKNREISSKEITEECLKRISSIEPELRAFITVWRENAIKNAEESDRRRAAGEELSVIDGIPMSVKDNICTAGIRTTCASHMLESFVPPFSATVYKKLKESGAIMLGKTNLDEFGMGNSTENSAFFTTVNPIDKARTPGGSSGGSAASVFAREAMFSIGSDTGGSVRLPAAYCGIVGLCPTYGALSRFGLTAFASSLDRIGPLATTARDIYEILPIIYGHDPSDAASVPDNLRLNAPRTPNGPIIGIADEYFGPGISDEVRSCILTALSVFENLGYRIERISLPSLKYALSSYYIISSAEASSNLSRYDGIRFGHRTRKTVKDISDLYSASRSEGFGEEVKRRILLGTFALSAGEGNKYYQNALKARALIRSEFKSAFGKCDIILSPVSPGLPPLSGKERSPLDSYLEDIYTVPSSLAGLPAISLPCGVASGGLPVGMQLIGNVFSEYFLLDTAVKFETVSGINCFSFRSAV